MTIKRPKKIDIEVESFTKESFTVFGVVEPDTKICRDDKLVLMDKQHDIDKLLETN